MFRLELDEAEVVLNALEDLRFNFEDEFKVEEEAVMTRLQEFVTASRAASRPSTEIQ